MADQTELAFVKGLVKSIAAQPVAFDDEYQAPPHLALRRVPILSIAVPPVPDRKPSSSSPGPSTLTLSFKSAKPPCAFALAVRATDTVADVKARVASEPCAPPADAQRLLLKGKALVDAKLLRDYDVKDGDTINLMVRPGFRWETSFPTAPGQDMAQASLAAPHRHARTPSIVLSPSPSVASLEPESVKPQDITLTLDTSTIPTASLSPATRSAYQSTISEPAFWSRLLSFLRAEFPSESDALIAFEDFLRASKGGMTASEIAKIRDHVGIVGMAGT